MRGSVTAQINAINPVLQGFELEFEDGDHHIHDLGVELYAGGLSVGMQDDNGDDAFSWLVQYVDMGHVEPF